MWHHNCHEEEAVRDSRIPNIHGRSSLSGPPCALSTLKCVELALIVECMYLSVNLARMETFAENKTFQFNWHAYGFGGVVISRTL